MQCCTAAQPHQLKGNVAHEVNQITVQPEIGFEVGTGLFAAVSFCSLCLYFLAEPE